MFQSGKKPKNFESGTVLSKMHVDTGTCVTVAGLSSIFGGYSSNALYTNNQKVDRAAKYMLDYTVQYAQ